MASDRGNLVRRTAGLCETPCGGLSQSVSRAMVQVGHIALLTKPIAETGRRERLAKLRHKKSHLPRGCRFNDGLQAGMHRDGKLNAGLLLPNLQDTAAGMLAAHADDI